MFERNENDLHTQARFERLPQPEEGRDAFWQVCCLVPVVSRLNLILMIVGQHDLLHIAGNSHSSLGLAT